MEYIILSANSSAELSFEVGKFLKSNVGYELQGGPYGVGNCHYQALLLKENKQLNG